LPPTLRKRLFDHLPRPFVIGFAIWRSLDLVDDQDLLGQFVRRDLVAQGLSDRGTFDVTARSKRGDGGYTLTELFVVDSDDQAVDDIVVTLDRLFNFFGVDLLARLSFRVGTAVRRRGSGS
jgi:hypothetical protein